MDFKKVVVATGLFTTILITSSTQAIGAQQKRVANVPPTEDGGMVYTASDLASLTPAARPGDVISPEASSRPFMIPFRARLVQSTGIDFARFSYPLPVLVPPTPTPKA